MFNFNELKRAIYILLFSFSLISGIAQVNLEWVNTFGGIKGAEFTPSHIQTDINNNTYVVGSFKGYADFDPGPDSLLFVSNEAYENGFIIKYNNIGEVLWAKQLVSSGNGYSRISKILIDDSLNFYIIGKVTSADFDFTPGVFNISGNASGFIAKYDQNGLLKWAFEINSSSTDCTDMVFDNSGNISIIGNYWNSVTINAANGTSTLSNSIGSTNGFILKYSPGGNLHWAYSLNSDSNVIPKNISINSENVLFISGPFSGLCDMDPGTSINNLQTAGPSEGATFFAKYTQNGNLVWAHKLSNSPSAAIISDQIIDDSSNVYLTGYFNGQTDFDLSAGIDYMSPISNVSDCFIVKYDSVSNLKWKKQITVGALDPKMTFDSNYNIFFTGDFEYFDDTIDLDPSVSVYSVLQNQRPGTFLGKYTKNGNLIWINKYTAPEEALILELVSDNSNNLQFCGVFQNTVDFDFGSSTFTQNANAYDNLFVTSIDLSGNFNWSSAPSQTNGGYDYGVSAIIDKNNNIAFHGTFTGSVEIENGSGTFFVSNTNEASHYLLTTNQSGDIVNFIQSYQNDPTPSGTDNKEYFALDKYNNKIIITKFGDTNIDLDPGSGTFSDSFDGNYEDILFTKFDSSGNFIWAKHIGNDESLVLDGITCDSIGNFYIIGRFDNDTLDFDPGSGIYNIIPYTGNTSEYPFIAKYNSNGNLIWVKPFELTHIDFYKIALDKDENIILTGLFGTATDFDFSANSYILTPIYGEAVFMAKYSPNGDFIWANKIDKASSNSGSSISDFLFTCTSENDIICSIRFNGTIDVNPGPGVFNLSGAGLNGIIKFNSNGSFLFGKSTGQSVSGGHIRVNDISHDEKDNIYLAGNLFNSYDFIVGSSQYILTSNGSQRDILFAKYDSVGNFIWANAFGSWGSVDDCHDIEINNLGEIFITGEFKKTVNFQTNSGTVNRISNGFSDAFIAKYSQPCNSPVINNITSSFPSICSGSNATLTVNGNLNDALNWTWFNDPGMLNEIGVGSSIIVSPTISTTYYVAGIGFCVNSGPTGSITVNVDNNDIIPPVANTQTINLYLDQTGSVSLNANQIDNGSIDNCGIISYSVTPNSFTCSDVGIQPVVFSITDAAGNLTSVNVNITIFDTINPIIQSCPNDTILFANNSSCSAIVLWDNPIVSDNCISIIESVNFSNGSVFNGGTNQVNYVFNDPSGNSVGCSFNVTIDTLITINSIINDVMCPGDLTGSIDLTVTSGTAPYNFLWSNSSLTEDLFNISGGSYTVQITDGNGCTFNETILISTLDTINPTIQSCPSDTVLFANNSGCSAIVFWDNPIVIDNCTNITETVNYSNGSSFNIGSTSVNYTFIDLAGNSSGCTFNVVINNPITINSFVNDILCHGELTGDIDISVNSGTPPYDFLWSNSDIGEDLYNVIAGSYSVIVTDNNDCVITDNFIISQPTEMQLSFIVTDEINGLDGNINLTVSGGVSPYTYSWSNTSTTEDISGLTTGNYSVIVTDSNGCIDSLTIFVGSQLAFQENEILSNIIIYPNPTMNFIFIEADKNTTSKISEIQIANSIGEIILNKNGYESKIDISMLPDGIYFLNIRTTDQLYSFKVIKTD